MLSSAAFDDEGVRTREQYFLEDGCFERFICDSYAARRLGSAVTGNAGGVFNVTLKAPLFEKHDILSEMHTGLLVTELMGQGVNFTNGDYSRGASGFWVEGGEIQFPVDGVTIAGNLSTMFASCVAVGKDVDTRQSIRTGSILVDGMTVSS